MPKLTGTTVLRHPETALPVVLLAGSDLPEWAVGQVGDHLLDEPAAPAEPETVAPTEEIAEVVAEPVAEGSDPDAVLADVVDGPDGIPVLVDDESAQPAPEPERAPDAEPAKARGRGRRTTIK